MEQSEIDDLISYYDSWGFYRKMEKLELEHFVHDVYNILDDPIDKVVEDSEKKLKKLSKKISKIEAKMETLPDDDDYLDEEGIPQKLGPKDDLYLDIQMIDRDVLFIEDELFALFEMKIIYSFKHLEINIKQLIKAAYNDNTILKRYRWEELIQFLSSKDIRLKEVKNYSEVNELRVLNNVLKHSDDLSTIKNIKEIKSANEISYKTLKKFYNRVSKCPKEFLISLCYKIYDDLYEFDENRLNKMAKSLAVRLDEKDSKVFIKAFQEFYK